MKTFLNISLALWVAVTAASAATAAPDAQWISVLNSGAGHKEKADACRELARSGSPEALSALVKLLPDEKLSHMARYAMEPIPGAAVDKALRDALASLSGRQLAGVISSLGVRRDTKAVKPLTEFLQNSDPDVAQAAARALGSIGTSSAVKSLNAALPGATGQNQLAIYEGLLRAAEHLSLEGSARQARSVYDSIRKQNPAAHQVRTAAFRGAVLTRGDDGVNLLLEALRGSDYSQAAAAARVAQEMRAEAVTRALASELVKLSADKQVLVLQTLGQRGDSSALPAIFKVLGTADKPVRLEALRAAARIADSSAVAVFVRAISDSDRDIARVAQESLSGIPGKQADAAVMTLLKSDNQAQQLLGMDLAARRRMKSALPVFFEAAKKSQPEVRVAAIRRVGELGGQDEIPQALDILAGSSEPRELEAAEQAVGALCLNSGKPAECADPLIARWAGATPAQKAALLRLLAATGGPKALAHVRATVKDSNPEVRTAAIRALSSWSSAEAAPDLLELARTTENSADRMVSLRGYFGLAKLSDVSPERRLKMCEDAVPLARGTGEKRLLLAALGDIPSAKSVGLIQPYLADGEVKEEAATAIAGIADNMLRRAPSAADGAQLIQALEKAADATSNSDLAARLKKLADQARAKTKST